MRTLLRLLRTLLALLLTPLLLLAAALALALADLAWAIAGRRRAPARQSRSNAAASIVIPNWNGRDLLERYLPSVLAATAANPANEVIVVDNGSTDGSADFVRKHFPAVTLLALETNLGFGGGSNAGFQAARNDIVVLLNSDMRVEPDFLPPLLEQFHDDDAFAVACQIFFTDPARRREETGLSEGRWRDGMLRVAHRIDPQVTAPFPCFYPGGGSSAFDRRRFLELGGFDHLLRPFYLEDTDIGYAAWKRGWKVLYEPRSVVYHEHRGTIGKHFQAGYIDGIVRKNFLLFTWKNIHSWRMLSSHLCFAWLETLAGALLGDAPHRVNTRSVAAALAQTPGLLRSRWRARSLATIRDGEAFRRPRGGYFRDRFLIASEEPAEKPAVLFISPYPIHPPVHGGAVFMNATVRELARHTQLHLICLLDHERERAPHDEIAALCASAELMVRGPQQNPERFGSATPHAVRDFRSDDLDWLIHRQILLHRIDAVQFEYTQLAQYRSEFARIPQFLFEHDVYFQSIARSLPSAGVKAFYEYLRALRFELRALPGFDRIQACTPENRDYLLRYLPALAPRIDCGLRAGVPVPEYEYAAHGRTPDTMLFIGSFRHLPNLAALNWFATEVLPRILAVRPSARLIVAGAEPPPRYALPASDAIDLLGFVPDIRELLRRHAVFVCPILTGSGVRVKLLEAFASGIPVVSTRLGAEGLAREDGLLCRLADDPAAFADRVVALLEDPAEAAAMASRARREVETSWDTGVLTRRLAESYRAAIRAKRSGARATEPACV